LASCGSPDNLLSIASNLLTPTLPPRARYRRRLLAARSAIDRNLCHPIRSFKVEGVNPDSASLSGTERAYHFLPHERRRVQRWSQKQGDPAAAGPSGQSTAGPTALALQVAAVANVRMVAAVAGCISVFAFVMAGITTAMGHPLASSAHPWPVPATAALVIVFWGGVITGVAFLVLAIVRASEATSEGRLHRAKVSD